MVLSFLDLVPAFLVEVTFHTAFYSSFLLFKVPFFGSMEIWCIYMKSRFMILNSHFYWESIGLSLIKVPPTQSIKKRKALISKVCTWLSLLRGVLYGAALGYCIAVRWWNKNFMAGFLRLVHWCPHMVPIEFSTLFTHNVVWRIEIVVLVLDMPLVFCWMLLWFTLHVVVVRYLHEVFLVVIDWNSIV